MDKDIKILFITSEYRGDHAADIYKIYNLIPNETVEDLVKRIGLKDPQDSIELKLIDKSTQN